MPANAEHTNATIQQLTAGFEATVTFAEHCRFLSEDRLASQAHEVTASAYALFKAAMYDLMAPDPAKPPPQGW